MTRTPSPTVDHGLLTSKHWRLGESPWRGHAGFVAPSARLIIDNDFSGDPDDLYQIVHHLLSPSVEIRAIVASHLRPGDGMDPSDHTATNAELVARDVFARMGLDSTEVIYRGSEVALEDVNTPHDTPAARAIIAEAMRDDTDLPLFVAAGGGLTDIASAYLLEPEIAKRMTLIWIGGPEHDGLALPPHNAMPIEYNLLIDVKAGQVLFGAQDLEIWQIPRDIYRQCLVSEAELRLRVAKSGRLGQYLYDEVRVVMDLVRHYGMPMFESYALGDSPLVLLTALRSAFEPDSSSSAYVEKATPEITDEGTYRPMRGTRPMRVYTQLDVRLMFEDFYLKLQEFADWQAS
jgi:purine nucleosidase